MKQFIFTIFASVILTAVGSAQTASTGSLQEALDERKANF